MLPNSPDEFEDPAVDAQCRTLLRGGSRSFHAASLVLPRRVREPATALYAFCRLADDEIDQGTDPLAAVRRLQARLDEIYGAQPPAHPIDRAFAAVVAKFSIPRALPEALIEGFAWDAQGRRYPTLSELHGYSARVAGTVGSMMALIMGARSPDVLARACEMGVAMQLTNIVRDIGEDARAGRLYLPLDWLQEAGIDPDQWLARPDFSVAIASIAQRLLEAADGLYARAAAGISWLPASCRPGMHAARLLYAEIGHQVERNGLNSVESRAHVAAWRKSALLVRSLLVSSAFRRELPISALDEVAFLVDAACVRSHSTNESPAALGRTVWLIDLFERLERRQLADGMH